MFAWLKKPTPKPKTIQEMHYEGLNQHQRRMYNHNFTNQEKKMFHRVLSEGRFFNSNSAYKHVMMWRPQKNNKKGVFGNVSRTYMHNR